MLNFNIKGTVALNLQIQDELEKHEKLFSFHLAAFDRMIGLGDSKKQDDQLQLAANHAAIITCLKGMSK